MKHIDNLFKEELGSFTEAPPPPVWDALEKRLKETRKKRVFPYRWFWYISLVSFITLLGAAVLWKMTGNVHPGTDIAALTGNGMPEQKAIFAASTITNSGQPEQKNDPVHKKHAKHHRSVKANSITDNTATAKTKSHIANSRTHHEQINTTQSNNTKSNDDLYADTDDDQYTVGYSSSIRQNTNEIYTSDHVIDQRNHNNIMVAEVDPGQDVREAGYGSRSSIQIKKEIPHTAISSRYSQPLASSAKEYAGNNIHPANNNCSPTHHHRAHKSKAIVAASPIAHHTISAEPTHASVAATMHDKRKNKVNNTKEVATNIVAASAPAMNAKTAKQIAVIAPAKENEIKPKEVQQLNNVTSSTSVTKPRTTKHLAATTPSKEGTAAKTPGQSVNKEAIQTSSIGSTFAAKAKKVKYVAPAVQAKQFATTQNPINQSVTKEVVQTNSVTTSTPVVKTSKAKHVGSTTVVKEGVVTNSTSGELVSNVTHGQSSNTASAAVIKTKKSKHITTAVVKKNTTDNKEITQENAVAASESVVNKKTKRSAVANTPTENKEHKLVNNITAPQNKIKATAVHPDMDRSAASATLSNSKTHTRPQHIKQPKIAASTSADKVVTNNDDAKNEMAANKKKNDAPAAIVQHKKTVKGTATNNTVVANNAKPVISNHHKHGKSGNNTRDISVVSAAPTAVDSKTTTHTLAKHIAKTQTAIEKDPSVTSENPGAKNDVSVSSASSSIAKDKPVAGKKVVTKGNKQANSATASNVTDDINTDAIAVSGNNTSLTKHTKTKSLNNNADKKPAAEQKAIAKSNDEPARKGTGRKAKSGLGKTVTPAVTTAPVFVYNNSISKRSLEDETVIIDNLKVSNATDPRSFASKNDGEIITGTFKQDVTKAPKPDSTTAATPAADSSVNQNGALKRFEYGVKGGYEAGFNKFAANKVVVSPYIQYNLSSKFAIMTQPSLKVSHLNDINVGDSKSYINTGKGSYTPGDSGVIVIVAGGAGFFLREYNYTQTYDSVVKSYHLGRNYMEFEMPLLLKYKIYKELSVYGGVNVVYGKMVNIDEKTYTAQNLTKSATGVTLAAIGASAPPPPPISNVVKYNTPLLATYTGPAFPSSQGDLLRLGYMLGFSYEYKKRWLFDVLVQQAIAKPKYEGGTNINAPLSLPYFRFTIGYNLTK